MEIGGNYQRRVRPVMVYPSTSSGRLGQKAFVVVLSLAKHLTTNMRWSLRPIGLMSGAKVATTERRFSGVAVDPETPSSPR